MSSFTVIILYSFVARAHAEERASHHASDSQDTMDRSLDKLVDTLMDTLLERGPKSLSLQHTDLDDATLGKAGHVSLARQRPVVNSRSQKLHSLGSPLRIHHNRPSLGHSTVPLASTHTQFCRDVMLDQGGQFGLASQMPLRPTPGAEQQRAVAAAAATTEVAPGRGNLNAAVTGVGAVAAPQVVTNEDIASMGLDTSDEWIRTRTGISSRRVLPSGTDLKSLASQAAEQAMASASVSGEDIDLVIVATSTPDDMFGDATSVAHAIGAKNAVAFDLTAACSGFLFAMVTGSQFLHNGAYQKAVVVGADALTRWVDWDDRNSCILFGDGAGAVVLEGNKAATSSAGPGILGFAMHSDGSDQGKLCLPYSGAKKDLKTQGNHEVTTGSYSTVTMDGKSVYQFATRSVPTVLSEALDNAGLTVDQVDWLLLHQANIRIMETVAKRLKIPMEKVLTNLDEHGNTSAGSIPIALNGAVKEGKIKNGDIIACAGFGAGLSWGAAIIRWGG
eukprot:gnl/MRDRNA2_/MRDRNA2_57074_c0_seq1.p1 gnl/MRDRNA2_/MRDRNA2_57074_c0~~gnl/MRDRNA2_/MRDRNA2_57074_c0_seq1.p1  ORF type:complete len:504 (+),score=74.70 gnl/MRDRNA2_/MRDRNA2_57074_c0_seq1:85-1596(+)